MNGGIIKMEYDIEIDSFGTKLYFKKGTKILHREDGPAKEYKIGDKTWWVNDKLHRTDGPAVEWTTGYKEWWINGKRLSPEKEIILNKWWNNKNGK
jgi:hypothetical protein